MAKRWLRSQFAGENGAFVLVLVGSGGRVAPFLDSRAPRRILGYSAHREPLNRHHLLVRLQRLGAAHPEDWSEYGLGERPGRTP
jgi:hypothetical protein